MEDSKSAPKRERAYRFLDNPVLAIGALMLTAKIIDTAAVLIKMKMQQNERMAKADIK